MRLDDACPRWRQRHRLSVEADLEPETLLTAVERLTWAEAPLFRTLMLVRMLGRGKLPSHHLVMTSFDRLGFAVLDRTDDELLVGAVVALSAGGGRGGAVTDVEGFRAFAEPGHVKIAFNFSADGTRLHTETRVTATDSRSSSLFGLYWALIYLGSLVVRLDWLRAARRRARIECAGG